MVKNYKSIKNWESKVFDTIIDVRSPSEFANDHIIGAIIVLYYLIKKEKKLVPFIKKKVPSKQK